MLERTHVSEADYLAAEERAATRSEYVAGEVLRVECGGLIIGLSLEDLYEDTGLSID